MDSRTGETDQQTAMEPAADEAPTDKVMQQVPPDQPEVVDYVAALQAAHQRDLFEALRKAQSLLTFATDKGIVLDQAMVAPINMALRCFGREEWSPKIEDDFLASYSRLSADLGDVSSESIEWSRREGGRATLWVALLGALIVATVIYVQYRVIYLFDSSSNFQETQAELHELNAKYTRLRFTRDTLTKDLDRSIREAGTSASGSFSDGTESLSAEEGRRALIVQIAEMSAEIQTLDTQRSQHDSRMRAQYAILSEWVSDIDTTPPPDEPGWFAEEAEQAIYEERYAAWRAKQESLEPHRLEYGVQQAISQLTLLNNYILPAIYGTLGTIAFVLRQISIRLNAASLRRGTLVNYFVRFPLGALSGIAVGLLLNEDTSAEGIAALQPLALAFVAGYSVELVFAAMDRLVIAFTGERRDA